jgi:hypothetical protein
MSPRQVHPEGLGSKTDRSLFHRTSTPIVAGLALSVSGGFPPPRKFKGGARVQCSEVSPSSQRLSFKHPFQSRHKHWG